MDVETVETLLKAWDLAEYIGIFTEQDINVDTLFSMPLEILKEIVPKIGPRCQFIKKRDEFLHQVLQDSNNKLIIDAEDSRDTISVSALSTSDSQWSEAPAQSQNLNVLTEVPDVSNRINSTQGNSYDGKKLRTLLQQSSIGRTVLSQIRLSNSDRNRLCHLIIDHLLAKSLKITSDEFRFWTNEIVTIFTKEKQDIWYNPCCGKEKRLATGKLWDKYTNLRKYVKKGTEDKKCNNPNTVEPVKDSAVLVKLRNISPDDSQLLQYWKDTFSSRDRKCSIEEYYDKYPVLKAPIGAELLEADYNLATKTEKGAFFLNWSDVASSIIQYATENKLCDSLRNQGEGITKETLALLILPMLFTPVPVRTGKKKSWKPSKSEISEAFILRINTIAELEQKLTERRQKLGAYGLQLQPSVIAVGPLNDLSTFVLIDNTKYVMSSLMGTVDLCFKSYYALDAHYPVDCEVVWQFLQDYLFKVTDKTHGKRFASIHALWLELESIREPKSPSSSSEESASLN